MGNFEEVGFGNIDDKESGRCQLEKPKTERGQEEIKSLKI